MGEAAGLRHSTVTSSGTEPCHEPLGADRAGLFLLASPRTRFKPNSFSVTCNLTSEWESDRGRAATPKQCGTRQREPYATRTACEIRLVSGQDNVKLVRQHPLIHTPPASHQERPEGLEDRSRRKVSLVDRAKKSKELSAREATCAGDIYM